ncbi:MAG: DNA repair protein RadC [Pseudomonadota bacterium]
MANDAQVLTKLQSAVDSAAHDHQSHRRGNRSAQTPNAQQGQSAHQAYQPHQRVAPHLTALSPLQDPERAAAPPPVADLVHARESKGTVQDAPSVLQDCLFDNGRVGANGAAKAGKAPRGGTPIPHKQSLKSLDTTQGHRARLRKRFDRGDRLEDYELLELVLFGPIPRRDTKPIAKAMMARFGSFASAIGAPADQLRDIDGVGDRVISDFRLLRAATERFAQADLKKRNTLTSTADVAAYYMAQLATAQKEEFHILFLDKKNQFLASECAGVGTVDHTPVYPREVLTRALTHGATGLVLVHNHPSGDPTPSRADVAVTQQIINATNPVGISVHDHIIIAGSQYLSLRGEGLI